MRAADAGLMVCHECHQLNRADAGQRHQRCTRCGARVHMRRPNSIVRTWALLITAALLYLPANRSRSAIARTRLSSPEALQSAAEHLKHQWPGRSLAWRRSHLAGLQYDVEKNTPQVQ